MPAPWAGSGHSLGFTWLLDCPGDVHAKTWIPCVSNPTLPEMLILPRVKQNLILELF